MKIKLLLAFVLILASIGITTCENPIMERWWQEEDPEVIFVTVPGPPGETVIVPGPAPDPEIITLIVIDKVVEVIKEIEYIYITVIDPEVIPSESLHEHLQIVNIDFIIFSGSQHQYNAGPIPEWGTDLTATERTRNDNIVALMARTLYEHYVLYKRSNDVSRSDYIVDKDDPDFTRFPFFLILHGHANPVDNTPSETAQLEELSINRARAVEEELRYLFFTDPTLTDPYILPADLMKLITTEGYGGRMTVNDPYEPAYTALNRRVEMILFTLTEEPIVRPDAGLW
jgi:hypothetical protein